MSTAKFRVTACYDYLAANRRECGERAKIIIDEYGLEGFFTVEQVVEKWSKISRMHGEDWVTPTAGRVEKTFNVELTEIGDPEYI